MIRLKVGHNQDEQTSDQMNCIDHWLCGESTFKAA